ncbi:unnamed protein product [Linum trigynum]|uniref:Uncharacterized protein n=2 Tax=Linum trigynum TaxID=586398 RepID=A0AAV2G952_9ROSI
MGKADDERCVFPLTSLQIGDLQSYLSDLRLYVAFESKKLYILVDNRPWLRSLGSRPAHLWQLMVTKSRLSPFANTKGQRGKRECKGTSCPQSNSSKATNIEKWFSLIDAKNFSQKAGLLPVEKLRKSLFLSSELHRTLYGFIVFEVAWSNVRGINYLNELQTDTSLAVEAKVMQRWEFDCISQASRSIASWFSGTLPEQLQLKEYLDSATGDIFYDAKQNFSRTGSFNDDDEETVGGNRWSVNSSSNSLTDSDDIQDDSEPHTPPPSGPYKRRRVTKSIASGVKVDFYSETQGRSKDLLHNSETDGSSNNCENGSLEAKQYKDVLILMRFDDHDLPFKLRQIIMADLRLLTLLEAGLPSWVIFLQSYPGFCHLYRPWMCPLARALYVSISIVTVIIGFYDLYKNVPVLKATASRLCGPLFDWIETWEMVSRIKYLGTMLFLHNFQKAVTWSLMITRTFRSFLSVFTQPLVGPLVELVGFLLPLWNEVIEVVEQLFSVVWLVVGTTCNVVGDVLEFFLWPIWVIISFVWNFATSILYPIFWILWEVIYTPVRMVLALASFLAGILGVMVQLIVDVWQSMSSIAQLASASEASVNTYQVSMWKSLWSDLFSQVFRAVRSILNGFVAFFTACNRHRLSIYNHLQDFIRRLLGGAQRFQTFDSRPSWKSYEPRNLSDSYGDCRQGSSPRRVPTVRISKLKKQRVGKQKHCKRCVDAHKYVAGLLEVEDDS